MLNQTAIEFGLLLRGLPRRRQRRLVVPAGADPADPAGGVQLGIGLFLAVLNARFRDVSYIVSVLLSLLFYMSPIIYPISLVTDLYDEHPWLRLYEYNPVTAFIEAFKSALWHLEFPGWGRLAFLTAVSVLVADRRLDVLPAQVRRRERGAVTVFHPGDVEAPVAEPQPAGVAIEIRGVKKRFRRFNDRKTNVKELFSSRRGRAKRYDDFWALKGIDLDIPRGDDVRPDRPQRLRQVHAAQDSSPASTGRPTGTVVSHGRISALLELGAGFHPELSGPREHLPQRRDPRDDAASRSTPRSTRSSSSAGSRSSSTPR